MDLTLTEWVILGAAAVYCFIAIYRDSKGRVSRTYTGIEYWKNIN